MSLSRRRPISGPPLGSRIIEVVTWDDRPLNAAPGTIVRLSNGALFQLHRNPSKSTGLLTPGFREYTRAELHPITEWHSAFNGDSMPKLYSADGPWRLVERGNGNLAVVSGTLEFTATDDAGDNDVSLEQRPDVAPPVDPDYAFPTGKSVYITMKILTDSTGGATDLFSAWGLAFGNGTDIADVSLTQDEQVFFDNTSTVIGSTDTVDFTVEKDLEVVFINGVGAFLYVDREKHPRGFVSEVDFGVAAFDYIAMGVFATATALAPQINIREWRCAILD